MGVLRNSGLSQVMQGEEGWLESTPVHPITEEHPPLTITPELQSVQTFEVVQVMQPSINELHYVHFFPVLV
jgi:hypothetical protein